MAKILWLIVRGLYNFSCILQKIWYINHDEGVICATWNPTSALTEMESSFFYGKVLIYLFGQEKIEKNNCILALSI